MKSPTAWKTQSGYDTATTDNEGFSLLLETGFNLLLETSGDLLLEDTTITSKPPSAWTAVDKARSSWEARDGYSTEILGLGDTRLTEQGDTRITEQGDTRIGEPSVFTTKNPTSWSDL